MRTPRNSRTSSALRSSIAIAEPSAVARSTELRRRADVERDAVPRREHGQRVGADLVGGVAVGGDPVGADEDDVDLAEGHQVPGGHVGDERVRDAGLGQLPGRQPGALQVRPGLVDPDVDRPLGMVGGLDDAERGPVLAAGQRPGVAVGQDADRAVVGRRQDLEAELGQPAVVGGRLEHDRVGLGAHRRGDRVAVLGQLADLGVAGHHPLDRPAQVDRRRAGVDQRVGAAAERRLARVRPAVAPVPRRSAPARSPRPGRSPARRGRPSRGSRRRPRRPTGTGTRRGRRAGGAGR